MGKLSNGRYPLMIELINDHDHPKTNVVRRSWLSPYFDKETCYFNHCQEISPREFYIRHKADGEVNYYLKLNLWPQPHAEIPFSRLIRQAVDLQNLSKSYKNINKSNISKIYISAIYIHFCASGSKVVLE